MSHATTATIAARFEVRNEAHIQKAVILRTVGRHDQFIRNGRQSLDHALDEGTPEKGLERLVLSHARGLSTGLNTNAEHLRYYKG
jgi:hypothetical protein